MAKSLQVPMCNLSAQKTERAMVDKTKCKDIQHNIDLYLLTQRITNRRWFSRPPLKPRHLGHYLSSPRPLPWPRHQLHLEATKPE